MSASNKKKLRKEQNALAMTEKQLQEQKEAKKLRLYTGIFAVAIAVMILVVATSWIIGTGTITRSTTALTVDNSKISAAELNHYYIDSINGFLQNYGDYVSLFGLDTTKPLDEQVYDETNNLTWADYFVQEAAASARNMYAVYHAAKAEGYTLSTDAKASIDASVENMALYATLYGYSSVDSYIGAVYGEGCNEKTFRDYAEVQMIASQYAADKNESLVYDDAAIRAEDDKNPDTYSAFSYNYYYLANSKFYEGGTEDEKGNKTYSEEEMEAGRAAAEAVANSLLTATTVEELDAAIAALEINAEATSAKSTRHENYAYSSIVSVMRDWITGERTSGDIVVIPNESTTHNHEDGEECTDEGDTTTVNGYYVVRFDSEDKNLTELVNVRHILISFEGGTTDETTGAVTYSEAEKLTAKNAAEMILEAFLEGETTEEAFGTLATKNTDDTGSKENGGLYENVYPCQMVTTFNDWCFDSARKAGDTGIVETEYGYHVMYFVGNTGVTYRDYMIESTLRSADLEAWENGLVEAAVLTVLNTKHIQGGLILSSSK